MCRGMCLLVLTGYGGSGGAFNILNNLPVFSLSIDVQGNVALGANVGRLRQLAQNRSLGRRDWNRVTDPSSVHHNAARLINP